VRLTFGIFLSGCAFDLKEKMLCYHFEVLLVGFEAYSVGAKRKENMRRDHF